MMSSSDSSRPNTRLLLPLPNMRHPVERSISMFHYLQEAYWEPTYRPEFKKLDLARLRETIQYGFGLDGAFPCG